MIWNRCSPDSSMKSFSPTTWLGASKTCTAVVKETPWVRWFFLALAGSHVNLHSASQCCIFARWMQGGGRFREVPPFLRAPVKGSCAASSLTWRGNDFAGCGRLPGLAEHSDGGRCLRRDCAWKGLAQPQTLDRIDSKCLLTQYAVRSQITQHRRRLGGRDASSDRLILCRSRFGRSFGKSREPVGGSCEPPATTVFSGVPMDGLPWCRAGSGTTSGRARTVRF